MMSTRVLLAKPMSPGTGVRYNKVSMACNMLTPCCWLQRRRRVADLTSAVSTPQRAEARQTCLVRLRAWMAIINAMLRVDQTRASPRVPTQHCRAAPLMATVAWTKCELYQSSVCRAPRCSRDGLWLNENPRRHSAPAGSALPQARGLSGLHPAELHLTALWPHGHNSDSHKC